MNTKHPVPEINASSMADIAFLLLIFFLVTTTMDMDKGLLVTLPEYTEAPPPIATYNERNVLEVLVNGKNQLLVEGEIFEVNELRKMVKKHVDNPLEEKDFAVSPLVAVVMLENSAATSYDTYIAVHNEIRAAYNELREEYAQRKHHLAFGLLDKTQQLHIMKEVYPLRVSEAEKF